MHVDLTAFENVIHKIEVKNKLRLTGPHMKQVEINHQEEFLSFCFVCLQFHENGFKKH